MLHELPTISSFTQLSHIGESLGVNAPSFRKHYYTYYSTSQCNKTSINLYIRQVENNCENKSFLFLCV